MSNAAHWLAIRRQAEAISGKTFPVESLSWAAGLFEGRGTVIVHDRYRIALKTPDEQTARRFNAVVGIGKVYGPYGPYKGKPHVEPFFYWCADNDCARDAAALMYPWLSERVRDRIDVLFETGEVFARARVA